MADKPRNGVMLILLGGGLAVMTHLRPQGLNVPPVIMDALCLAIVSAGVAISAGRQRQGPACGPGPSPCAWSP